MADGGASNMILLVTALLICSVASAILIQSWSETASAVGINQDQMTLDSKTKVTFSGDIGQTVCDAATERVTIYLQNSGTSILDENNIGAFIDGSSTSVISTNFLNGATIWSSGVVVEYVIEHTENLDCDEEIRVSAVVSTVPVDGVVGTDSMTEVVKLG